MHFKDSFNLLIHLNTGTQITHRTKVAPNVIVSFYILSVSVLTIKKGVSFCASVNVKMKVKMSGGIAAESKDRIYSRQ